MRGRGEKEQLGLWDGDGASGRNGSRLRAAALGTGSSGNAYVIGDGETWILLDCGLGVRDLQRRLAQHGLSLEDLTAVVLSHGHDDHVRGAIRATEGRIPVFATGRTFEAAVEKMPRLKRERPLPLHVEIAAKKTFVVGSLEITPHPVPHDWPSTFGFVVSDGAGGRVAVATDVGHPEESLLDFIAGANLLFLEFNHDLDWLRQGPYPAFLKARVAGPGGHLANHDAADSIPKVVGGDTKRVVAVHLSRENNRPHMVEEALLEAVERLGGPLGTSISDPFQTTPMFLLDGSFRGPGEEVPKRSVSEESNCDLGETVE